MMNRNILHPMMFETPTPPQTWGIYWNSQLWLISLSADSETWITLADKNLGATQVYNDWDVLSQANCWWYFQWWNNYMFPFSWEVTTSWTQVAATNYWPYYDSNLRYFKTGITESWDSSWNPNLWWDTTNTWGARRWPAIKFNPNAYVPSFSEISSFTSLLSNLWISADEIENVLLMPKWWEMYHSYGNLRWVWEQWSYWTSTWVWWWCRCFQFNDDGIILYRWLRSGEWLNIRCFLHDYEQWDDERQLHTGVRWSPSKEYIRVTDWTTTYVLMDKNLWATQVYMVWDTYSESNCWYFYQWWNNHWFPGIWSSEQVQTTDQQVNATNYWPYYYSDTFRITNYGWESSNNTNLWWWVTWTKTAMRWPCPEWYHISNLEENENLVAIMTALWISNTGSSMKRYLKMPFSGYRDWSSGESAIPPSVYGWRYWASEASEGQVAYEIYFTEDSISLYTVTFRAMGQVIRPFKNTPVVPDSTRTKLL